MKRLILFILLLLFVATPLYAQGQDGIRPSFKQGYARSAGESKHPALWRGLVGAWNPALGVTGNTLHDISTFKNHGTLINMDPATDWVIGQNGYALDLDGDNDSIPIENNPIFDFIQTTSLFSLCVRVKFNNFDESNSLITKYLTTDNNRAWRFLTASTTGILRLEISDDGTLGTNDSIILWTDDALITNKLYSLVATINIANDEFLIYVDGQEVNTTHQNVATTITDIHNSTEPVRIGALQGGSNNLLDGIINDIRIYDRVLLPLEILDIYINPNTMFELRE